MTARLSPAPASPGMRPWRQRWLALAALLAAAAVLLLAAPQRRSLGGALLRAVLPGHAPDATTLCTMSQLDGFVDGDVRWDSWARLPARAGKLPPWRPPWLSMQRRCTLRRFSPQQARQCLAGRPLVMIGDSVTRYQFLSLLYYLEFGEWPAPGLGRPGQPSPVVEREWAGGWNAFYNGTTAPFGAAQACRCFREGSWDVREDRFYTSGNVSATFFMWFGFPLKPLTGLWGFPPYSNGTRCPPGRCSADPDWALPLDVAIREVVSQFKPHTLVFNSGLWRTMAKDPAWPKDVYRAIMQAANAAVAPQGGQAIWKTTTYDQAHGVQRDRDEVSVAQARAHGWRLMDAWALTREAALSLEPPPFVDNVHFYGYVYAELNHYLLNMICPPGLGSPQAPASAGSEGPGEPDGLRLEFERRVLGGVR